MGRRARAILLTLSPLALIACNGGGESQQNIAALDNEIAGNGADPALMGALQDQIMVDPNWRNNRTRTRSARRVSPTPRHCPPIRWPQPKRRCPRMVNC